MMKQDRESLVKSNIELEMQLFPIVRPPIPDDWLNLDLTMLQFKIMLLLYTNGSIRIGDIASKTGVSVAAMTGITDRLEMKKLLVREHSSEDRRVVVCSLTDEGRYWVGRLWKSSKDRWELIMSRMTLENLEVFNSALRVILEAAEGINWENQE